jgi:ribonucleoside-diphosphate reductase alpha chain
LPSEVSEGVIFKDTNELGRARYDFQFANRRGYKTTIEGIGESAPSAIIDYSKIITELLQANSPIKRIIYMLEDLTLSDEMSSTWRRSVIKLLKSIM